MNKWFLFIGMTIAAFCADADIVTVESPRDGFLSLRSEPSVRTGSRLKKIPHATALTLGECRTTADNEIWCRTSYQGETGWISRRYAVSQHDIAPTANFGGSTWQVGAEGFGPITFGMAQAEAENLLGQKLQHNDSWSDECFFSQVDVAGGAVSLRVENHRVVVAATDQHDQSSSSGGGISTTQGIRVGDTLAQVEKAYNNIGGLTKEVHEGIEGDYPAVVYWDSRRSRGLLFEYDQRNQLVMGIRAGTDSILDRHEGCNAPPVAEQTSGAAVSNAPAAKIFPKPVYQLPASDSADWMALRYAAECGTQSSVRTGVPCPYEELATCIGEGCFVSGTVELNDPVVLFSTPGSNQRVYVGSPGEFLVYDTSVTYSVPCPAKVNRSAIRELQSAQQVYQLSYAGEEAHRYLVEDRIVESSVGDSISLISQCAQREEQWIQMTAQTGTTGWALIDYSAFLGLSRYDALTSTPPQWARRDPVGVVRASHLAVTPDSSESIEGITAEVVSPSTNQFAMDLGNPEAVAEYLKRNFPETYSAIMDNSLSERGTKASQLQIAYVITQFVGAPEVGATFLERLQLDGAEFLRIAVATTGSSDAFWKAGANFTGDVGVRMAEEAAVSAAAALATDVLFRLEPMQGVDSRIEAPLRAFVEASLVELYDMQRAMQDPSVLIGKAFDRYNDIREIAESSRSLANVQDRGLLATALSIESAAMLVTRYPGERSTRIAQDLFRDIKATMPELVGKDDAEAVATIFQLGYDSISADLKGDRETAFSLVSDIRNLGQRSGNIQPFSAIFNTVDWLTAAANWGEDAPERAAHIMIGATLLASVSGQNRIGSSGRQGAHAVSKSDTANAANPGDAWGPGIVPTIEVDHIACNQRKDDARCLRELGLADAAIDFSYAINRDYSGSTTAASFRDLGSVDLAIAQVIGASNHSFPVLLNGSLGLHPVEGTSNLRAAFRDDASQNLLRRYPKAESWNMVIFSHRLLPDGTQRFTLIETLTDACRACPVVGEAVSYLDVGPATGGMLVRRPISIGLGEVNNGEDMTADDIRRYPERQQVALNALGYDAGPMDGLPGEGTAAAVRAFQAEHCIAPTGTMDQSTLQSLADADPFAIAPCEDEPSAPPLVALAQAANGPAHIETGLDSASTVAQPSASTSGSPQLRSSPKPADRVVARDGATLTGELTDGKVLFKSTVGDIEISVNDVHSFADGKLRLADGTILTGVFGGGAIGIAADVGASKVPAREIVSIVRENRKEAGASPSDGTGLTRGLARDLIISHEGYPKEETEELALGEGVVGVIPAYDDIEHNKRLSEAGLGNGKVYDGQGFRRRWSRELTEEGGKYVRRMRRVHETAQVAEVLIADVTLGEITGIAFLNAEETVARIEYTVTRNITPFWIVFKSFNEAKPEQHVTMVRRYDDGWRIER